MKATIVVLAVCLSLSGIAFAQEKSNAAYENAENLLKQGEVFKAYDKFLKAANLEPQNTTYKQRLNEVGKLASAQAESNGREKMNIAPEEAELWFRRAVAYDMSNGANWFAGQNTTLPQKAARFSAIHKPRKDSQHCVR